jgi:hypothetical protein
MERLRVGIVPAHEHAARPRLLAALERALPVTFEARAAGDWRDLDAVIAFGPGGHEAAAGGLPVLMAEAGEAEASPASVAFPAAAPVDRVLRGARLTETHARPLSVAQAGIDVLATVGGLVGWARRGRLELLGAAPAELADGEPLRQRLSPGRSLALLALVHFLRAQCGERGWERPPLQAAFILDDPNLHWPSYGHVRYPELARHAEQHGYHVAVAMVPLDSWLVHPRVAQLFRRGAGQLSVCVHGNDHTGPELGRLGSDTEAAALAGQALRRAARFERRARVPVSRVMVPPHERLSEHAARGLRDLGFEAVCVTRPYPWTRRGPETPWLTSPDGTGPLVAWGPTELVAGGLPLILRVPFPHAREDLVLRAFLGQPIVLYGHHGDLHEGLDVLAEAAAFVNGLGPVRWGPLDALSRGAVESRAAGRVLAVRPHTHRVIVDVPDGIVELRIDLEALRLARDAPVRAGVVSSTADRPLPVAGSGQIELDLRPTPTAQAVGAPPRRLWPIARRLAGEGRDRMAAVLGA